jgi:chemotaxis protein MotA
MDKATIAGLVLGFGGVFVGNMLEGGNIGQIINPIAGLIVLGGTIGATMVQFPMSTFVSAIKSLNSVLKEPEDNSHELVEEIVRYATIARKDGILALESLAPKASDPFLSRALMMAVDGADSTAMRESLEPSIAHMEEAGEDLAKVYEAAGGFSPTIGIIGAVLGLIQVMQNLSDIAAVGHGIASAFVATIYGVAFANLVALPVSGKLKLRTRTLIASKELILEGALAIQQGMNPKLIRERLMSFTHGKEGAAKGAAVAAEQAQAAA